ncbi:hypothetical protein MD484_g2488, partial [Candolleomyces efflorescens]
MQFTRVVLTTVFAALAGSSFFVSASPIPAPAPVAEAEPQGCQMLNSCT